MTGLNTPSSLPVLAIGDVHGMSGMLADALRQAERLSAFPILLGDLIDKGPDSVGVLRLVLPLVASRRMALVRGNHDEKLLESLLHPDGRQTRVSAELRAAADADELLAMAAEVLSETGYWLQVRQHILVHGAFHPDMLSCPTRGLGPKVPRRLKALALYGETDGSHNDDGLPVRTYAWVHRIPEGITAVVGHDTRQLHEPLVVENADGGKAVFLDTGAAKGGKLSTWLIT